MAEVIVVADVTILADHHYPMEVEHGWMFVGGGRLEMRCSSRAVLCPAHAVIGRGVLSAAVLAALELEAWARTAEVPS